MSKSELFRELRADDPDPEACEIESLCLRCGGNGITRVLLTKIPFYKEVVIMSFSCNDCGWENNELKPASVIQPEGIKYDLKLSSIQDLNRQVVKTEYASVNIPEIEFEIPSKSQEGLVTTIEGLLDRAITGLGLSLKNVKDADRVTKISDCISKLNDLKALKLDFHFVLDDISGNSFIENPHAPDKDENLCTTHYVRTHDQDKELGIVDEPTNESQSEKEDLKDEVLSFPTNCSLCGTSCETKMKVTQIPHFKEVVIMATTCDHCGHKTNEIKSGAGIEPKGTKIKLNLKDPSDLTRDVLKSETCTVLIPELEFEAGPAVVSGRFTTVEGLLEAVKQHLTEQNPFIDGDSAVPDRKNKMNQFIQKLNAITDGKMPVTFIMDDPCGNSYLQNFYAPEPDPEMEITHYERTFEQKEELGLNDIKTENYEERSS